MEDISAALKAAEELVEALKKYKGGSPADPLDLLSRTDKVRAALEQPFNVLSRQTEVIVAAGALYSLILTGAIQKVPNDGSITAEELAAAVDVDVSAITRLMRVAISNGVFIKTSADVYAHNALSQAYQVHALGGFFLVSMDFNTSFTKLPEYVEAHKPGGLFDLKKSPFAFVFGKEGLTYYGLLEEDVEKRDVWNKTIQSIEKNMPIAGMFLFSSLKEQAEKEPDRPFFLKLQEQIPGVFGGKLILQDLPIVLDSLKPEEIPNIKKMAYDIFTPQPMLMSTSCDAFSMTFTTVCIDILKNTALAMGPDSRLIICDMLVPEKITADTPKDVYGMDLNLIMMSGREKQLKEFEAMFAIVGLELVKIWPSGNGTTVQLETRLKRS
ncbi:hypothetical protein B0H63DRAFT_502416 [Podospora didyma]|uniref:O-methyltransferase dimerisation domain-containing protein n=1 Tax=Podospora didyma TaxID=330526 RepID=A0AAE0KKH2_9PEZI|nr:hypothetical protein B0H63DRAFT_502416 [Podospora didyma]